MKKLHLLLIFIIITSVSMAQYITPGKGNKFTLDSLVTKSGGVVTYSNGVYKILKDVTISKKDTFCISAPVTMIIDSAKAFTLRGIFTNPTKAKVIVSPKDTTNFASVYKEFRIDSTDVTLENFKFYFGGGLKASYSTTKIQNCDFYTLSSKFNSSAFTGSIGKYIINNCTFVNCQRAAISSPSNSGAAFVITNSKFLQNSTLNGNYPQINLGYGLGASDSTLILNNTIIGKYIMSGGIAVSNLLGAVSPTYCRIENNVIDNNRYGISFTGAYIYGIIANNVIKNNNIQNSPNLGGSGINLTLTSKKASDTTLFAKIYGNEITNNLWGITLVGRGRAMLGSTNPADKCPGRNKIYNNVNTNITYNLYNNAPYPVNAVNNDWGVYDTTAIEATIVHKKDIDSLGKVTYSPFLKPVSIASQKNNVIKHYSLEQNYPNPFNPTTNIRFSLPTTGYVEVKVFNVLGKEVETLAKGNYTEGTHNLKFNAANYSSGIYFYSIKSNNFSQTRKMLLLK